MSYQSFNIRGNVDDVQQMQSVFSLSGKALVRNQAKLSELLRETLEQARFDELPRLRELIFQIRVETENSITSRGHSLVMTASSSGLSPAGKLSQQWYGLEGIQKLKQLDKSLDSETELKSFANSINGIRTIFKQWLPTPSNTRTRWSIWRRSQLRWQHRQL
jgi:Zn-dependent M16 (insulinase) family peptidase